MTLGCLRNALTAHITLARLAAAMIYPWFVGAGLELVTRYGQTMPSDSADPPSLPPHPQANAGRSGASQLWVCAGNWLVRADHVIAAGVREDREYRQDRRKHSVRVATAAMRGNDGDIEPATYVAARFADQTAAVRCATTLVERMGSWTGGQGFLFVSKEGTVLISRGNPRGGDAAADPSGPADSD
jgi:hypothetical protein